MNRVDDFFTGVFVTLSVVIGTAMGAMACFLIWNS